MAVDKKLFLPHEDNIMRIRQIIADIDKLKEELSLVEISGNRPVEYLIKARSNLAASINILKNV